MMKNLATLVVVICWLVSVSAVTFAQKPSLVVQTRHRNIIRTVVFSPDGKVIASGGEDRTIKLWEVATGRELRTLSGHSSGVKSVAFSPDGKSIASSSEDKTIKLWDVATGRELHTLSGHSREVMLVAFSPDGKSIASSSRDNTIKLWDVTTGRELRTLSGFSFRGHIFAFSPDGKSIANFGEDNTIKLWDVTTGRELRTLSGHSDVALSVVFSSDGKVMASGSGDDTIKLWDVATGRELRTLSGHSREVMSVAFSPDGKSIASGSLDNTIKLWDVATGRELRTLSGHLNIVYSVALSPDGNVIASGSLDETIKLWDAATGRELRTLSGHSGGVSSVAFSPDGKSIASGSFDNTIKLWDVATGRELRALSGHSSAVTSVAFGPDGKSIVSGSANKINTIKLWDVATGRELRTLSFHSQFELVVAVSPDGKSITSGSDDKTIKLWDVATGRGLRIFSGHSGGVRSVAFSPDGKSIASGSDDKTIKLWDVATGRGLRTFSGHSGGVRSVAFSPDGKSIASGSDDTIKLWEVATGRELRILSGHSSVVLSVAFSSDGKTLASCGSDASVKLWNVATGDLIVTLFSFGGDEWAVVDPEGRFDASPEGMKYLHYVVGLKTISLKQMKEGYYEPGLLSKLLGFNKQPVRDARALANVPLDLFPEINAEIDKVTSRLNIKLTNQGGGIGRVQVFINDKEYIADARSGQQVDPKARQASITVNLANGAQGVENKVRVVAWNTGDRGEYLSSDPITAELSWIAPGKVDTNPSTFYAIVGGVSTYSGEPEKRMNLNFPAVDAREMARLLKMAAEGFFINAPVKINLLASNPKASATGIQEVSPTKMNFKRAFEEVARQARSQDIVVIFLAGHGITFGNSETGKSEYGYLTQEASALEKSAFANPAIRAQQLITGGELVEWNNKIAAKKIVIILDTCEAGSAQKELLALLKDRDVPADQIRALDDVKERTGLHVLMGAAANKASYETSTFGRGLLTHALTEGFSGPGLTEEKYVEVGQLFQYARRRVEELARSFSEQRPHYLQGSDNFKIGMLEKADRDRVNPRKGLPLLLPPMLFEFNGSDSLDLTESLRKELRLAAANNPDRDQNSKFRINAVYADLLDLADALQLRGTYNITGSKVVVNLSFTKNKVTVVEFRVEGVRTDTQGLMQRLLEAIEKEIDRIT